MVAHIKVDVELVRVGERHRPVNAAAVDRLAESMRQIGLRQPITIRVVDEYMEPDGEIIEGVAVLVTGRHRLEAARQLGWSHIDAIDADDTDMSAEMWEIAENLHRLDLTKEQRDEHIRRYADLLEARKELDLIVPQNAAKLKSERNPKGAGRPQGIPRQIAEETGLSVDTVRRALSPPPRSSDPIVARLAMSDEDAVEKQVDAVMAAWNRACPEARERVWQLIG